MEPMEVDEEDFCLSELSEKLEGFPPEYAFLLSLSAINNQELRQHTRLWMLLSRKQTTIDRIIELEIATVCLYWAQSFIECKTPLFESAQLTYERSHLYRPEGDPASAMYRVDFQLHYPPPAPTYRGEVREAKRGMVLRVVSANSKIICNITTAKSDYCILTLRCRARDLYLFEKIVDLPVVVYEIPQEFVPMAMLRSIQGMQTRILDHIIVPQPQFSESLDDYKIRRDREQCAYIRRYVDTPLTDSQMNAIYSIATRAHGNWPMVVFGPPGTGKTCTITAAIQVLLRMSKKNRILVCTPSNMAADRVAEKLIENFDDKFLHSNNVLRLRSTGNDYAARDQRFDPITSRDTLFEKFQIPECYDQWRVVVCTLGCSAHLMRVELNRGFFSHIIIDEAGQCSEAEMWIPIGSLAAPNTSIILCGDPKQLGPVVTLDLSQDIKKNFESPLHRYTAIAQYKEDERLCCLLSDCFRCPEVLVSLVSATFYDKKLRYRGDHKTRALNFDSLGIPMLFPILFVDVEAEEQRFGYSFGNFAEADVILSYTAAILRSTQVEPKDIGVITPYRYQMRIIIDKMRKDPFLTKYQSEIAVDSVERFQGSERSCIIMSTVRTSELGFVKDDLRVNTSLTRAQNLLIVVGNGAALSKHISWRTMIGFCRRFLGYKKWD